MHSGDSILSRYVHGAVCAQRQSQPLDPILPANSPSSFGNLLVIVGSPREDPQRGMIQMASYSTRIVSEDHSTHSYPN